MITMKSADEEANRKLDELFVRLRGDIQPRRLDDFTRYWAFFQEHDGQREYGGLIAPCLQDEDQEREESENYEVLRDNFKSAYKTHEDLLGHSAQEREQNPEDQCSIPKEENAVVPIISEASSNRSEAFSEFVGWIASQDPSVIGHRNKFLAGRLLTFEEMHNFLDSPALQHLSCDVFDGEGIPYAGHHAELIDLPPETDHKTYFTWNRPIKIIWNGKSKTLKWTHTESYPMRIKHRQILSYTDQIVKHTLVWPGSALEYLSDLSEAVAKRYSLQLPSATEFILTGAFPYISPIRMRRTKSHHGSWGDAKIELSIQPWVTPEEVKRAYQSQQEQLGMGKNYKLQEKTIALFRFYISRLQSQEGNYKRLKNGQVREMIEEWNSLYPDPEWKIIGEKNFRVQCRNALKRMTLPQYMDPLR
ncbi:MAG: hypothetical protein KY468_09240 [Armatimonadetes bacterium]|nr:hypothetical protein [Armatimonadota bacterium]